MSSSPAKGTTALFLQSCGNFTKVNKQACLDQVNPIKELLLSLNDPNLTSLAERLTETRSSYDTSTLILPTSTENEVFIRNSTFRELRGCCVDLLDTLPEKKDILLRKFLIDTEEFLNPNIQTRRQPTCSAKIQPSELALGT